MGFVHSHHEERTERECPRGGSRGVRPAHFTGSSSPHQAGLTQGPSGGRAAVPWAAVGVLLPQGEPSLCAQGGRARGKMSGAPASRPAPTPAFHTQTRSAPGHGLGRLRGCTIFSSPGYLVAVLTLTTVSGQACRIQESGKGRVWAGGALGAPLLGAPCLGTVMTRQP